MFSPFQELNSDPIINNFQQEILHVKILKRANFLIYNNLECSELF